MNSVNKILLIVNILLTGNLFLEKEFLGIIVMAITLFLYVFVIHHSEIPSLNKLLYLIVSLVNVSAFTFDFYTIEWFDNVAHVLNAFAITLIIPTVFYETLDYERNGFIRTLTILVSFTLMIGVVWELWEYFADIYVFDHIKPTYEDTIMDLVYDGVGAVAASLLLLLYERK